MRVFRDILVMPTQGMRHGVGRPEHQGLPGFFRGGPVWPYYAWQVGPRHCQGLLPIPIDRRPRPTGDVAQTLPAGVWCGPVAGHFGHMIRDFGSRIARSVAETGDPLVFSIGPDTAAEPQPFFREILDRLGAGGRPVILVRAPVRFERLAVFPQEERAHGPGPSRRYLDLLDRLGAGRRPDEGGIDHLFVSRARIPDGKLVGEGYLDAVLARLGVVVIHPELMPLAEQLAHYRRARVILASEGSALHGLQLLGRLDADLVVLVRRNGRRFARAALRARVRSLRYWNGITGLIYGCHSEGRPQLDRALALFDTAALADRLRGIGLDVGPHWDAAAYAQAARAEILRFVRYNQRLALHPASLPTIQRCLDANRIDIDARVPLPDPA